MRILKLRCKFCGYWNRVPVNKVLVEQDSPEPKVKIFIPMYLPLQASKREKCGEVIAQPKELIKIVESGSVNLWAIGQCVNSRVMPIKSYITENHNELLG